jgi:branched-chain amino acid aminotransferase
LSEKEPLVYIDGTFYPKSEAKISIYDHGFLYGDGVFEGIRAYDGNVFKLKEHVDRLYRSAHSIKLDIPLTKEEMMDAVLKTLRENGLRNSYIRLIVTRGVGDLGLDPRKCPKPSVIIIAEPLVPIYGVEAREKGVTAIVSSIRRDPVDATTHEIKSLNYLNSILAKLEANEAGVNEAIFLDHRGLVCEATGENIFIVKEGKLYTPPTTTGALLGVTRQAVIELAEKLGYEVREKDITLHELFNADEAFMTGTAAEIAPLVKVSGRTIGNGKPGAVTKRLIEEFQKITRIEGTRIAPS